MHKEYVYVTNTFLCYCEKCNDVIDIGCTGCVSESNSTYFLHSNAHTLQKKNNIYTRNCGRQSDTKSQQNLPIPTTRSTVFIICGCLKEIQFVLDHKKIKSLLLSLCSVIVDLAAHTNDSYLQNFFVSKEKEFEVVF